MLGCSSTLFEGVKKPEAANLIYTKVTFIQTFCEDMLNAKFLSSDGICSLAAPSGLSCRHPRLLYFSGIQFVLSLPRSQICFMIAGS